MSDEDSRGEQRYIALIREAGYVSLAVTAVVVVLVSQSEGLSGVVSPLHAAVGGGLVAVLMFAIARVVRRA